MPLDLFSPYGVTTAVSVSGTTAAGTLTMPAAPMTSSVRVYNSATVTVFIKFGVAGITATTSDMPIPTGGVETFEVGPNITTIAAITAGTAGTLYATPGRGA